MRLTYLLALLCLVNACRDPMATLPTFSFKNHDGIVQSSKDFPEGKRIVLFRFESDCRDCQHTTDSLLQNMHQLKNVQFYLLSTEDTAHVNLFRDYYKLDRYLNITVGQDYTNFLSKHFKTYHTPFIALYNTHQRLIGVYDGEPLMKELVKKIIVLN